MKMIKPWLLLLTLSLLMAATSAQAGRLGRPFGLGWSDGYHAQCGCDHRCGFLHRFLCSDPCWHDPACIKTKVVSPGCFDCQPNEMPAYNGPTYVPQPEVLPAP